MMINANYDQIIAKAKASGASIVSFDRKTQPITPITAEKDTLTLSDRALAMMNGEEIKQVAPTYIRPQTAKSLLTQNETVNSSVKKSASDIRFDEMMQSILDKNLGIDREKLEEIEAMMKEIAKNENLTPEQKQKAMEELEKMKEKVIEESLEVKKQAKRAFTEA